MGSSLGIVLVFIQGHMRIQHRDLLHTNGFPANLNFLNGRSYISGTQVSWLCCSEIFSSLLINDKLGITVCLLDFKRSDLSSLGRLHFPLTLNRGHKSPCWLSLAKVHRLQIWGIWALWSISNGHIPVSVVTDWVEMSTHNYHQYSKLRGLEMPKNKGIILLHVLAECSTRQLWQGIVLEGQFVLTTECSCLNVAKTKVE